MVVTIASRFVRGTNSRMPRTNPIFCRSRQKIGFVRGMREFVPRTNREAIVTTIDSVADQRAQLERNHALVLDGQIRDAAPRIEPMGRRESRGRARVETAPTRPAIVRRRRIGYEFETEIDLAEEQPRPEFARDKVGVLTLPTDPGLLRQRFFHDRGGVDKQLQPTGPLAVDPPRQSL